MFHSAPWLTVPSDPTIGMIMPEISTEQRFINFLKARKCEERKSPLHDIETCQIEIDKENDKFHIRDKAVLYLCEFLFENPNKILQQIKSNQALFLKFTSANPKAQKYLLRGFELTILKFRHLLMTRVPHILKAFYDFNILDENIIVEWYTQVPRAYGANAMEQEIRLKAWPFVKYLSASDDAETLSGEEDDISDDNDADLAQ